jgi:serine/threonine protein kinase
MNNDTGAIFVVKVQNAMQDPRDSDALLRELNVLQELRHPHIVSYLGHEVVKGHLCICIEYMPGGSLRGMLQEFGAFKGERLRKTTRGVLEGLNYLHTHNPLVVHRDLKGANVLMDHGRCWPKLADFGCSKISTNMKGSQSFSNAGSIPWMAPEMINAGTEVLVDGEARKRGAGRKADIWSLGCVILEMASAANPWGNGAFSNVFQAYCIIGQSGNLPPIPDDLQGKAREFLALCLRRDVLERPCAHELLLAPFMQGWELEPAAPFPTL